MPDTKLHYKVGDRFIETTPSGKTLYLTVTAVNVEPKYPQPEDYPYVRLQRDDGKDYIMGERVIDAVDWIAPLPDERNSDD